MSWLVNSFNTSKIAWGLSTIAMQYGARFVIGDLTESQTAILQSKVAKRIVTFCMVFVATRDVMISVIMTVVLHSILSVFFNETSKFSLISANNKNNRVTQEQYNQALRIADTYVQQEVDHGLEKEKRTRVRKMRTTFLS
jgi:hypothetical protein